MPLLLLDLDNTLVDRDAAFRFATTDLLATHGLPATDLDWVLELDASGYRPRGVVARGLLDRYPMLAPPLVQGFLDNGAADAVTLAASTRTALRHATALGWTPVIVTNGRVRQQEKKIQVCGLGREVAGWVISEGVGAAKPDAGIFARAAEVVGARLADGGWVVGDSARADIGGAQAIGYPSVWLPLGRIWPAELEYQPTRTADNVSAAIHLVLDNARGG
ncbi:HAD family hydrolase [Actinopolymorpha sp. B11F2]|uniref:HAD family hydrolase n=1 Tax=Actinopolymorpha sp. B11F2 TaxID=3160862 RepID=UPI0032E4B955